MQALIDLDIVLYKAAHAINGKGDFAMGVECIENILSGIVQRFPDSPKGYLTGKNNFRYQIDPLYKANRKDSVRPPQLKNLREYLLEFWDAEISDGNEADDLLGLNCVEGTVICSTDKDLKTIIDSYNYNFTTGALEYISEEKALTNFYCQMLTGDSADNIPGIKNSAKKYKKNGDLYANQPNFTDPTARKLLEGQLNQEELVIEEYKEQEGKKWKPLFDQRANLLWIQQKRGKTYEDFKNSITTAC